MRFQATQELHQYSEVQLSEDDNFDLLEGENITYMRDGRFFKKDGSEIAPIDLVEISGFLPCLQQDLRTLLECLANAGSQMKTKHYFKTHFAGVDDPKYRERIYCYELYHQLRVAIGDQDVYRLDGEMDKRSHPDYVNKEIIPDFLVHVPRTHLANLAVIEVKSANVTDSKLEHDLNKLLDCYTNKRRKYFSAMMLIYSDGGAPLSTKLVNKFFEVRKADCENVILLWHPGPGQCIRPIRSKNEFAG